MRRTQLSRREKAQAQSRRLRSAILTRLAMTVYAFAVTCNRRLAGSRASLPRIDGILVIVKYALGGAVEIIVLTGFHRPDKRRKPGPAHNKRYRNEIEQRRHRPSFSARMRKAFNVTMTDEPDMARAARSGVTNPNTASGIAHAL